MTASQYMTSGAHQLESIQADNSLTYRRTSTSGPPAAAAYSSSDLTPSSAVSSFNVPATTDSTLLTPVSSAGSPPLQQRLPKTTSGYYASQTAVAQQPTPPQTSKMYYPYDLNHSSQASSPMSVHPQGTQPGLNVSNYANSSPRDGSLPNFVPYLGSFGVSDTSTPEHSMSEYNQDFMSDTMEVEHTSGWIRPPIPVSVAQYPRPIAPSPSIPNLGHPSPELLRGPRPQTIENIRDPHLHAHIKNLQDEFYRNRFPHGQKQPRRFHPIKRRPHKKTTPSSAEYDRQGSQPSMTHGSQTSPSQTMENEPEEELFYNDSAPEDDKLVFELRKKYSDKKGKGMWDDIINDYAEKFQKVEKAALQMKLTRGVSKYAAWPEKEDEALKRALDKAHSEIWSRTLSYMKEYGGCKVWNWKEQNLESRAVFLGLVEPTVDEKTKVRKRKQRVMSQSQRRISAQAQAHEAQMAEYASGFGAQLPPYGLHPAFQGPRRPSFEAPLDDYVEPPHFTPEQENEIVDDIFKNRPLELEDTPEPAARLETDYNEANVKMEPNMDEMDVNNQGSQRTARQACDQLLEQQHHQQQRYSRNP